MTENDSNLQSTSADDGSTASVEAKANDVEDEEQKSAGHPVNSLPMSCRRVKLYEIGSSTESWVDKGTGFCHFEGGEDGDNPKLVVDIEFDGIKSVVSTYIRDNSDYSSQNESIIIWHEGNDTRLYRALSFQNILGHNACWAYIRKFLDESMLQSSTSESGSSSQTKESTSYRMLPSPSAATIQKLDSTLDTLICQNGISDALYLDLLEKKWLKELFEFMNKSIENEELTWIPSIASILLRMVLNWCGSLELMLVFVSDEIFFDLLRAFEYDSELLSQNIRMNHVKFFQEFVKHHDIVPLKNSTFYQLIHANYRMNYLKDVVLPRHLDEFSIQRMNSTIYSNMTEIMGVILTEECTFFEALRAKLSQSYMAALLLRELLVVARGNNILSQPDRNSLILMVRHYQLLNELTGYLDQTANACQDFEKNMRPINTKAEQEYVEIKKMLYKKRETPEDSDNSTLYRPNLLSTCRHKLVEPTSLAIEIFYICMEIFPAIVRAAVFTDAESGTPKLLMALCGTLVRIPDCLQAKEIIMRLLDPKSMDLPEKDEMCRLFYDKGVLDYMLNMVYVDDSEEAPESSNHNGYVRKRKSSRISRSSESVHIMEILSLCAREHRHRFKLRMQSQNIPLKIMQRTLEPFDKFLAVGALKFLRVCIQMKDSLVERHIIKNNVLRSVLWILNHHVSGSQGSVLESICLSILSAIECGSMDNLIVWLFDDQFCSKILSKLKETRSYSIIATLEKSRNNLKSITITKRKYSDPNAWFEEDDDTCTSNKRSSPVTNRIVEGYDDVNEDFPSITKSVEPEDDPWMPLRKRASHENKKEEKFVFNLQPRKITVKLKSDQGTLYSASTIAHSFIRYTNL
ncbi:conserved hypothetical protein [Theileria equi strain WA]|uniref:Uncharacterized protein n=1 Tax=Theileria equi strain WA TaxID=1537102 RepID=L1LDS1_THEEQ|nr:conserved hypothetical protein [Theileria equi strain WA]EKX73395.1 conserved hypothetical protein [Theileria equi strain WA]|eukprot:XP_004832847.1 conserved hypothetical protein [Theileria equi strain WA]